MSLCTALHICSFATMGMLCLSRGVVLILFLVTGSVVEQTSAKLNNIAELLSPDINIQKYVERYSAVCPYLKFCSEDARERFIPNGFGQPCCRQCSCSPICFLQHDCCIDAPFYAVKYNVDITSYMSCGSAYINAVDTPLRKDLYIVDSCPQNDGTKIVCSKLTDDTTLAEDLVLVSDRDGLINFRNSACARCHNVTDIIRWKLSVANCKDDVFTLGLSGRNLMAYAMKNCILFSEPPTDHVVSQPSCKADAISGCSPEWNLIDPRIVELCDVFPGPRVAQPLSMTKNRIYKNVFCLLCSNPIDYTFLDDCPITGGGLFVFELGFILNLNLFDNDPKTQVSKSEDKRFDTRCLESEIMDPFFMKCRPLTCPFQATSKYGTCLPSPLVVKDPVLSLSFIIRIHEDDITLTSDTNMTSTTDEQDDAMLANSGMNTMTIDIQVFLYLVNITSCNYIKYITENYISKLSGHLEYIHLKIYLLQTRLCSRSIIEYIFYDHVFSTNGHNLLTMNGQFIPHYTVEPFVPFPSDNNSTYNIFPHIDTYDMRTIKVYSYRYKNYTHYYYGPIQALPCPFLFLNEEDFLSISSTSKTHARHLNKSPRIDRFISRQYYVNGEPVYMYFICLEDYIILPPNSIKVTSKKSDLSQGIVTLVFAISSIVCIIVCMIAFYSASNKRSIPSRVFQMALFNLLLAQAFFQFGVERTNLPYLFCVIIGMSVHYFWLATVFSLNAFCVLVATNLSAINGGNRVKISVMVKSLLYIYVLPALFVGANIIYSKSVKGKFGYGDKLCYIDEAAMRGLLFAAPIFFMVFVNCFVYFYIVYKTRATSAMSGRKSRDAKYATVYFRLLLLTGVAWVFGFLNELVPSVILQYCFIVTIAGQGIFLLFAFYFGQIRSAVANRLSSWTETSGTSEKQNID